MPVRKLIDKGMCLINMVIEWLFLKNAYFIIWLSMLELYSKSIIQAVKATLSH